MQAAVVRHEADDLGRLEPAAPVESVAELYALAGSVMNVSTAFQAYHDVARTQAPPRVVRDAELALTRAQRDANTAAVRLGLDCRFA